MAKPRKKYVHLKNRVRKSKNKIPKITINKQRQVRSSNKRYLYLQENIKCLRQNMQDIESFIHEINRQINNIDAVVNAKYNIPYEFHNKRTHRRQKKICQQTHNH